MFGDDGSVLARRAVDALSVPELEPHIGYVDTVQRDGVDVVMVEVRRELRGDLTPRLIEVLAGIPFRLRDVRVADGVLYGGGTPVDDSVHPDVIVESMADDRPVIVRQPRHRPSAAGPGQWIDVLTVHSADEHALVEEGFTAIEDLMGEDFVAPLWPEQHRRTLPNPERESGYGDEDEVRW